MDAVDPAMVDAVERTLRATDGVRDVGSVRLRWIGHTAAGRVRDRRRRRS